MILKPFLKLFGGSLAVNIITLLFYPFLGRLFTPSDFGAYGVVTSSGLVLSIFITGQFHSAFPQLPPGTQEGKELLILSFVYTLTSSILLLVISYFGAFDFLLAETKFPFWIIALFTFTFGLSEIVKMWLIYLRSYGQSSWFVGTNRLVTNLLKVGFPKSLGLVHSDIITNFFISGMFLKLTIKSPKVSFDSLIQKLKKFKHYPIFFSFGVMCSILQQELPVFVFKKLFSANLVGLYVMSNKFTVQAILMVSSSLILVLANRTESTDIVSQVKKIFKIMVIPTILMSGFLYVFGENLFKVFLGTHWAGIGEVSAYLSLLILPKMLFSPVHAEILRSGRVKFISLLRCIQILLALAFFYFFRDSDFFFLVRGYVLFDFFSDIVITIICLRFFKKRK